MRTTAPSRRRSRCGTRGIDARRHAVSAPVLNDEPVESVLLDGLTAQVEKGGDLTDQIFAANTAYFFSVNEEGNGIIQITYAVFDKGGHCATYMRNAVYPDYHAPRFTGSEPLIYTENDPTTISACVSAKDVIVGGITSRIRLTSSSLSAASPESISKMCIWPAIMPDAVFCTQMQLPRLWGGGIIECRNGEGRCPRCET